MTDIIFSPSSSTKMPPIISLSTMSAVHHLPSFWDDASDAKLQHQSQRSPPKRKEMKLKPEDSPPSSPEVDESFKAATLIYVESPAGRKALDMEVPPQIDAPSPPDSAALQDPGISRAVAVEVNPASPLLSSSWPRPPSSSSPSPTSSISTVGHTSSASSSSPMTRKSSGGIRENPDSVHDLRHIPFRGSGIPATPPGSPTSIARHARGRTSNGSIRRNMDGREGNYGLRPEDVIYMTVVTETSV
jgi:hypothetical protein